MQGFYEIGEPIIEKLNNLKEKIRRFQKGGLSHRGFKALRVPCGIYEQRTEGIYMIRVRIAGGGITSRQAQALADISRKYGDGSLHVTTRLDIQIHGVEGEDHLENIIDELLEARLTSFAGGGNSLRNVTNCPFSEVCPEEILPASRSAIKLTEIILPRPDSSGLPRKYKISFSGCRKDCAHGAFTDLGFIPVKNGNKNGYRVFAGGGLGARPDAGIEIYDFITPDEVPYVAEGVKQLFNSHGNREDKHAARLRFVRKKFGDEKFRKMCHRAVETAKQEENFDFSLPEIPGNHPPTTNRGAPDSEWFKANTRAEKEAPYRSVVIPVPLGDIQFEELKKVATLSEKYTDGNIYTSQYQGLILKGAPENKLKEIRENLEKINTNYTTPLRYIYTRTCKGAATCKLGLCLSQNLENAIHKRLAGLNSGGEPGGIKLFISGCPNCCGQHFLADLGFFGAVKRKDKRAIPCYRVVAGGRTDNKLARDFEPVSAYRIPDLVRDYVEAFSASSADNFPQFFKTGGESLLEKLIEKYAPIPDFTEDRNYYYDWGAEKPFEISKLGEAECGAGVIALIESDLKEAHNKLDRHKRSENNHLYRVLVAAARALLVTRGEDATEEEKIFSLFKKYFVDSKMVNSKFASLIEKAKNNQMVEEKKISEVEALLEEIEELYNSMDSSFKFPAENSKSGNEKEDHKATVKQDLRGVGCPINYVKAKLFLENMETGETLSLLLDEGEPIENVPASLKEDGHKILKIQQVEDYYRLLVEKSK